MIHFLHSLGWAIIGFLLVSILIVRNTAEDLLADKRLATWVYSLLVGVAVLLLTL